MIQPTNIHRCFILVFRNLLIQTLINCPYNFDMWIPKGGYFISFNVPNNCAKRVVALAAEAGVKLTGAGATYPYKNDPNDSNIRLAPSCPTVDEIEQAMQIVCLATKIAAIEVDTKVSMS